MIVGNASTAAPMLGMDRSLAGGRHNRYFSDTSRGRRQERRTTRRQERVGRQGWRTQLHRGQL